MEDGMRLDDAAFDTEQLYTTAWKSPHHDLLDVGDRHHVLAQTGTGRLLKGELSKRGLGAADVSIDVAKAHMVLSIPRGLAPDNLALPLEGNLGETAVATMRALLDAARANLTREYMMAADGWRRGGREPDWAMLTTPIAEILFHRSGYTAVDVLKLGGGIFDAFGRVDAPHGETGDARDAIPENCSAQRVGPLLKVEGEIENRITFAQGDRTRVAIPLDADLRKASHRAPGRAYEYGVVGDGGIAGYLASRRVRNVRRLEGREIAVLDLEVPVITAAEVPEIALAAVGLAGLPTGMRRYPVWAAVNRVPSGRRIAV
jgi:hypothetical protein